MQGELQIRQGTAEDIDDIARVYANSVRLLCQHDYDAKIIAHWQVSTPAQSRLKVIDDKSLWVAQVDTSIVGYLVAIPGEIVALFIDPDYAGVGIGRALGLFGIKLAMNNNISQVILESTLTAAPFYEKLGFKEISRGYFSHGVSDLKIPVINMALPLKAMTHSKV
jgi:GNAT superfamily N-acetyltransferase